VTDWRQPRTMRRELRVLDVGGRVPPHDLDVERALIAHVFSRPGGLDEIADLDPADWYSDAHRRIHEAALELQRVGTPVDLQTIGSWLNDRGLLQAVGGTSYLAKLIDATPVVAHVDAYVKIVADKAGVRRLIETCQRITGEAFEDPSDFAALANRAAEAVHQVAERKRDAALVVAYDAMVARVADLDEQWQGRRSPRGLPTGLDELDELTGGLRPGALSVVAAVTGGGKSAFALQVARHVAGTSHNGEAIGVVYVSLEMPVDELVDRTLCSLAAISDEELQTGALDDEQRERLRAATNTLGALPLWFYTAPVSATAIRSLVRRAGREFIRNASDPSKPRRIGLVVVDYLGLMDRPEAERNDLSIGMITRALKLLAMELGLHVMLLAQFNRDASNGTEPPKLRDLKDSSSIEQDSNFVFFLHRLWLLLPDRTTEAARALKDCVEIILAKGRRRDVGSVFARFNGKRYTLETPHAGDVERWDHARPKPRQRRSRQ
jgi:replicative DNA helicase